jgi:hypothetical protein
MYVSLPFHRTGFFQPHLQDLDILCISSGWSEEGLKSKVIELNPRFYRIAARDPSATYTVLWYRIADNGARLKVDLMLPGAMNIPVIPVHTFDTNNLLNLACAPLSLVLLLKLQAWVQHGEADEARYYMKQPTDAQDILELLSVARQKRIQPRSESYFPNLFVSRAESRAEKYVSRYPGTKASWMDLGFVFTGGNNRSTRLSSGSHLVSLGQFVRPRCYTAIDERCTDSFDMYY